MNMANLIYCKWTMEKNSKGRFSAYAKVLRLELLTVDHITQGKVERVHRSLHSKMRYDLLKRKHTRILNEDPKEELASISPFEVYMGINRNLEIQAQMLHTFVKVSDSLKEIRSSSHRAKE